ncbi:STKc_STK36 domain-containing protein fused [Leptinotarsa decemlineata]|uniref:STKc_STK36 domain-containing protein fused n=1 Tax=Leptinotarsa decemlineata TaxID=7539 RepID=UPI003D304C1F
MDKYEVIRTLGEGSFGRVYKAKQLSDDTFVALKVISKRGRSAKELKGFRRECEIQRHLHHPNVIRMLDSFETENEIVVITEFAQKTLSTEFAKTGFLTEDRVQKIVWDLVSALYYLHSNRILHRDLKPPNILLDTNNRAKLCDFGFARNMSTGTHVLTSIKGTPLYMAPELIDEKPYDYNADLWSLGCIMYELLMGSPPFCTKSLLQLIRLIRYEEIKWPTFSSENCMSFLKGLLQKNPLKRLTWDEILSHPFVKGHIIISKNSTDAPLTRPLSPNTLQAKEQQMKDSIKNKHIKLPCSKTPTQEQCSGTTQNKSSNSKANKTSQNSSTGENIKKSNSQDLKNNNSKQNSIFPSKEESSQKSSTTFDHKENSIPQRTPGPERIIQNHGLNHVSPKKNIEANENVSQDSNKISAKNTFSFIEDNQPIETEEWILFLQRSLQEVIAGEMVSLTQIGQTNVLVSPLRNPNANSKVLSFVARLLSIPFVVKGVSEDTLVQIKKVYLEVKLVPNLVYATKLLVREHYENQDSTSSDSSSPIDSPLPKSETYRRLSELCDEDVQALEYIFLLVSHLVHTSDDFLLQFCDAIVVLSIYPLLGILLSLTCKRKVRVVADLLAILSQLLRKLPENCDIVEKILIFTQSKDTERNKINFVDLLRHSSHLLRERTCLFILLMSKNLPENSVKLFWDTNVRETLEALVYDSIETVRNAAELTVLEIKSKSFYSEGK